jgi:hypothetical protein
MPSFLNAVYDITLTAAPPSTNILVNGLPLTILSSTAASYVDSWPVCQRLPA